MTKLCPTLMDCYTVLKLYWVLTQFFQEAEPQPVWTSTPSNPLSAVESEDLTLSWSYNINGTLAYAKLFYIGDSQSKKLIALKPSVGSDINLDAAFQDRFFLNISDTQALVKIIAMQRSDKGTYRYEITNLDLVSISSDVEIIVLYAPNITEISGSREVNESDVLRLKCTADGDPTPNITWTKVSDNSTVFFPLTITGKQNEGLYRCTAQNGVGRPESSEVNITVENYHPIKTQLKTNLKNNTAVLNTTFNITCSAQANPPAKYRFYKGKGIVLEYVGMKSVGPYTAVVNNKEDHQVNYSCIAYNEYGNGLAQVATVSIQYPPSFTGLTIISGNTTVLHDTVISFNCSTDALPDAHMYEFYFNGNHIGNTSSGVLNTTVKVDGVYTCVPINTVGTGDKASVIITTVVPPSVEIFPQNATVVEGHNITLECNSPGKPGPVIIWTKVGRSEILSRRPSLVIMNVSRPGAPDNMIQYQCTASNGVGTPATATVNITVHYPPSYTGLTIVPGNTTVLQGSTIPLNCRTDAKPDTLIYHFYFNGNLIGNSSSGVFNTTVKADGEYTCVPINTIGAGDKASLSITVVVPPSLNISSSTNIVLEGKNLMLTCKAAGKPKPILTWTIVGSSKVLSNTSTLTIINVRRPGRRDNAIRYQCTAFNGVQSPATATAIIIVYYPPTTTILLTVPGNNTVLKGSIVSLKCDTDASPLAHVYHFYFNDNHIGRSDSGVFHVTAEKDGNYTCVPLNTVGMGDNATVIVTVVVASSVDISSNTNIAVEGSILELTCNASGIPKPVISWKKVGDEAVLSGSSSQITVTLTRPETPGNTVRYQCIAHNGVGSPATASITVTVLYRAQITVAPINQTVQVGEYASLKCRADGSPAPTITWTHESQESERNVGTGNSLYFDSTRFSDSGWYKCTAENRLGPPVTARAYLDVVESASNLVNANMTIENEKFDDSLKNRESERYRKLSERVVKVVEELFVNDNNYHGTNVKGFESGSVVVLLVFEFQQIVRIDNVISVLKKAAMDGKLGNFIVDPLSITAVQKDNSTPSPSISTPTVNPYIRTPTDTSSGSQWIIIGPVIGVGTLVVVVVVICFCWICRKQSRASPHPSDIPMYDYEYYQKETTKNDGSREVERGVRERSGGRGVPSSIQGFSQQLQITEA